MEGRHGYPNTTQLPLKCISCHRLCSKKHFLHKIVDTTKNETIKLYHVVIINLEANVGKQNNIV